MNPGLLQLLLALAGDAWRKHGRDIVVNIALGAGFVGVLVLLVWAIGVDQIVRAMGGP